MSTGPLAGIRILEFSQIVAGPFAGVALAQLGADVVKVEPLEGEGRRNTGAVVPNEGKYFQSLNIGKRSLTVDLSRPEGQALIHRIIPTFDVVISNYRVGVPKKLNIDYATLSRLRPGLIYATITGFGETGPYATRAGSDIVAQAYSGLMSAEGKVDEYGSPASISSTTMADRGTGLAAAMGIIAALYHRASTGEGQEVSVSLIQTALELLSDKVMREPVQDATLRDPIISELAQQRSAGASYQELLDIRKGALRRHTAQRLYYGGYGTKSGALVLGALTKQNRVQIRQIIGMTDDLDDPDYDSNAPGANERFEAWHEKIQSVLMTKTAKEWVELLLSNGVPASEVNIAEEMSEDPHVVDSKMIIDLVHPITGPQKVVGPLVKMSVTPTGVERSAPPLGYHTREVLVEAGVPEAEISVLIEMSVISDHS